MNRIIQRGVTSISLILLSGLLGTSIHAAGSKGNFSGKQAERKDSNKFPTGCTPVGFEQSLKILSLYPGKEGALQSMYFFYNQLPKTVSLYQMRDKESEYSTRLNHSIKPNSWAVLATGERQVKFICSLGDGKAGYGQILDCADTIKVCEYVNVRFGLNNKGNLWIVDSNSRNGAVSEVVHYGIIPGV